MKDSDGNIINENGQTISPLDDDYNYYKYLDDCENDPLSDDYVREEYR